MLPRTAVLLLLAGALAIMGGLALSQTPGPDSASAGPPPGAWEIQTVAENLIVPWALAFSPSGRLFFTERPGTISVIDEIGARPRLLLRIADVATSTHPEFAAGLMGLALDPRYPEHPYLYVYYTYQQEPRLFNRVARYREVAGGLVADRVLLDKIPGSFWQNGGRIEFGPDGKLYVPTGGGPGTPTVFAAGEKSLADILHTATAGDREAQDVNSLASKILRLDPDGGPARDNPFSSSPVYSYGHRHSQGMAWHPASGALYITEHGPPGGWDEINVVEPGKNYGWPHFKGHTANMKLSFTFFPPQPYVRPLSVYTPAIAPAGATFYSGRVFPQWKNSLFIATLFGGALHRLELSADGKTVLREERLLLGTHGRLRAVVEGPDGFLYVATSNRDQAGESAPEDDRILRIVPARSSVTR